MAEYTKFQDFYINDFLPQFEKAKITKESCDTDVLAKEFKALFGCSFLLLKYFLHNNGLFQFREKDVLRETFYIEFLKNGEEWMILENIYKSKHPVDSADGLKKYFYCFENLKKQFKELV